MLNRNIVNPMNSDYCEVLRQIKELEEKQTALFEVYHKNMYETQIKINELRKRIRKMEDSK